MITIADATLPARTCDGKVNSEITLTPHGHKQREPSNAVEREDILPNGGYGWGCVACVFLINAHTWGVGGVSLILFSVTFRFIHSQTLQAYGVFLAYYLAHNTYPSATPLQ